VRHSLVAGDEHAPRPGTTLLAASEAEHPKTRQASQDTLLASY
jgi:hypothetical protein